MLGVRWGQKRKWLSLNGMSALPSETDIVCETGHVRKVPNPDIGLSRVIIRQASMLALTENLHNSGSSHPGLDCDWIQPE
jgi:hypothetical protein